MARFVVKNAHPRERAEAAAEPREEQQRLLGYPARARLLRAPLIVVVDEKGYDVDKREEENKRQGRADTGEG